jgi:hypothetical protein
VWETEVEKKVVNECERRTSLPVIELRLLKLVSRKLAILVVINGYLSLAQGDRARR